MSNPRPKVPTKEQMHKPHGFDIHYSSERIFYRKQNSGYIIYSPNVICNYMYILIYIYVCACVWMCAVDVDVDVDVDTDGYSVTLRYFISCRAMEEV